MGDMLEFLTAPEELVDRQAYLGGLDYNGAVPIRIGAA